MKSRSASLQHPAALSAIPKQLRVHVWSATTSISWRRGGSASTDGPPVCDLSACGLDRRIEGDRLGDELGSLVDLAVLHEDGAEIEQHRCTRRRDLSGLAEVGDG